jgi:hypothetical protein
MTEQTAKIGLAEARDYARGTELKELEQTNKKRFNQIIAEARSSPDWQESLELASDALVRARVKDRDAAGGDLPEGKQQHAESNGEPEQHHPEPKEVYTHKVETVTIEVPIADLHSGNLPVHCNCRLGKGTTKHRQAWKRVWQALKLRETPVSSHRPIAGYNEVFRWFLNVVAEKIEKKSSKDD